MEVLLWIFAVLLVIAVLTVVTVVLVIRAVCRRIRRSRALGGRVLRARARVTPGPRGRVLGLRVRLADALSSGASAVEVARTGDGPRGELDRLYGRIRREGEALDRQLKLMESEVDAAVVADELHSAEQRVEQVVRMVRSLRSAVASGLADLTDDSLAALRSEVDHEVAALHAGVDRLRTLNGRDAPGARHPQPMRAPDARLDRSR
ncbi:hypothetical protein [Agromyces arachidis]|uniref:hypothetical protein n=1 Tax=Agromyces arachidis TaxID=766966 RepID=UPI0040566848